MSIYCPSNLPDCRNETAQKEQQIDEIIKSLKTENPAAYWQIGLIRCFSDEITLIQQQPVTVRNEYELTHYVQWEIQYRTNGRDFQTLFKTM